MVDKVTVQLGTNRFQAQRDGKVVTIDRRWANRLKKQSSLIVDGQEVKIRRVDLNNFVTVHIEPSRRG